MQVKALACELPSTHGVPLARWSRAELARHAQETGLVGAISGSTMDLHPRRSACSAAFRLVDVLDLPPRGAGDPVGGAGLLRVVEGGDSRVPRKRVIVDADKAFDAHRSRASAATACRSCALPADRRAHRAQERYRGRVRGSRPTAPAEGAHHRDVFLVLRRHAGHHHGAATVRTRRTNPSSPRETGSAGVAAHALQLIPEQIHDDVGPAIRTRALPRSGSGATAFRLRRGRVQAPARRRWRFTGSPRPGESPAPRRSRPATGCSREWSAARCCAPSRGPVAPGTPGSL